MALHMNDVHLMKPSSLRLGYEVAVALAILSISSVAGACEIGGQSIPINLEVGRAATLNLKEAASRIFVTDPTIADIDGDDSKSLVVYGLRYGTTSICITSKKKTTDEYVITVKRSFKDALESIKRAAPEARLEIADSPGGIIVTGSVNTPIESAAVKAIIEQYLSEDETLTYQVSVSSGTQVNLKVRVAEVSRTISKQLGINWDSIAQSGTYTIGLLSGRNVLALGNEAAQIFSGSQQSAASIGLRHDDIAVLLDALRAKGLVSILAEPNLTAASGASASFLAGGELPIPVAQGSGDRAPSVSIEYKKFGVGIEFSPTVLDDNRINIKVSAEVSEVSDFGAIVINGFRVPSLTVRRVNTTIDLAAGQTFAVAGLFKDQSTRSLQDVPGIGDVPIIGALFRSSQFQRNDSEVVILVTPYLVNSQNDANLLLPQEKLELAPEVESLLLGRLTARSEKERAVKKQRSAPNAPSVGEEP